MSFRLFASLLSCTAILTLSISAHAQDDDRMAGKVPEAAKSDPEDTYKQLNLFGDVFERVRAQYVDEVKDKDLIENAINGMLTSLDPHSSYMNEKDFGEMQVQTRGEFGGLGIEVTMENGLVKVVSPIDDTPAFRAGVHAGDYITHLDGKPIVGMTLNEAVDKMRGKVGTPIKITLRREGQKDPIELSIVRDTIKIKSVKTDTFENSIGYIRITTFNQNTDEGVKKAVDDMKAKLGDKLIGVILDLRNNPGGLLDQAIAVSDDFLDKGEIVSTRGRHEDDTKRDNATRGDIIDGLPIVVLINGGSASASEIVSGALQDHRRAIILGTQSFGKGSVQTVIPLPGNGAMRLTTARYYTPSGRSIQAKGITPDIMVEQSKVEKIGDQSAGLHEADLRGALANPDDDKTTAAAAAAAAATAAVEALKKDTAKEKTAKSKEAAEDSATGDKAKPQNDYQLSRAIDLLRGVSLYGGRLNVPATEENKKASKPAKAEKSDKTEKEAPPAVEPEDTEDEAPSDE